jgi:hypothetical protein
MLWNPQVSKRAFIGLFFIMLFNISITNVESLNPAVQCHNKAVDFKYTVW